MKIVLSTTNSVLPTWSSSPGLRTELSILWRSKRHEGGKRFLGGAWRRREGVPFAVDEGAVLGAKVEDVGRVVDHVEASVPFTQPPIGGNEHRVVGGATNALDA